VKRFLLSVLIALVLVGTYLVVTSIIFIASEKNMSLLAYMDFPMRLPKLVYFSLFPPTKEDYSMELSAKRAFLALAFFAANVLLYSIPTYFILFIVGKFRKPKPEPTSPPPPPSFVSGE
jgi:hypothetical protein